MSHNRPPGYLRGINRAMTVSWTAEVEAAAIADGGDGGDAAATVPTIGEHCTGT